MTSNRFIYFILSAFIAGNLLLIFMQYNSSKNIHNLITGNKNLLNELKVANELRELERDLLSTESKIRGAVATNDTTYLDGVDSQIAEAQQYLGILKTISDHDSTLRNINRLSELADEKRAFSNRILDSMHHERTISPGSFKVILQQRRLSNEINAVSRKVYSSRQRLLDSLSVSINSSGRKANRWGIVMFLMVLVSEAGLFWYIISRIRRQNYLIQQVNASEKKVREMAMIKETFMTNMSHEIRTPMNAILGFTNLLKARNRDPALTEFVTSIGSAGENLLAIINDILDLSKIEAGMMRIESAPFGVRELLHSLQAMLAEKIVEKGLEFSVAIDDSVPETLSGDATRLTQILVNMIGNAIKFTHEGEVGVVVHDKGREGGRIRLEFVIRDTGIGIAKEKLAGIFERFRQAEDSITRKYGGTGLGLAISKDLILLQGGEIDVVSEPGVGTRFRFMIPYEIAAGHVAVAGYSGMSGSDGPDYRHIRILVVEDNVLNQRLLTHLLNGWKLSFDMAGNGLEALEKLRGGSYDLVLMDVQMPEMDGYTAMQEIRQQMKLDIPVIAMTAHAFAGEREKCLRYGMNEYISKPINERELYELIRQFTGIGLRADARKGEAPDAPKRAEAPATYQFIDLQYMREISEGDREYESVVTEQFLEAIPLDLEALESALENGDLSRLRQTAHNMRTNVSIMGLLDKLQGYLDVLEYEPWEDLRFRQVLLSVKAICLGALPEARDFYATLVAGPRG
ncbi:MAG TPA: response regulator [Puia sp.]|nr:response regulator [Puia sp.]